jgi:hypothetical protein
MTPEGADIFDVRDNQLENYLRTETGLIKAETDTINTNITNLTNTVNGIVPSPGAWETYTPVLYRGSTEVGTSTVRAAYTFNAYLCFVSLELLVTSTSSWPGGQVASISLPVGANTTSRQLGIGVYNNASSFRVGMAFIESTTSTGYAAALIIDSSNDFAGVNPNITGNRSNDRWYLNLTYRPD